MGRLYSIPLFSITGTTTSMDIIQITAADNKPFVLHSIMFGQKTDYGDAEEEIIGIELRRGDSSAGSGGVTGSLAQPINPSYPAAGLSNVVSNTTQATGGVAIYRDIWNVRLGYLFMPTPEMRFVFADRMVLRMGLPTDSIVLVGDVIVEELG